MQDLAGSCGGEGGLDFGGDDFEGGRVDVGDEVTGGIGLGDREEAVVEADFGVAGIGDGEPVEGALDFAVGGGAAGAGGEIGGAVNLGHVTGAVVHDGFAFHDAGVFEADFAAGFEAEEFGRGDLGKVVGFDPDLAGETEGAGAGGFVFGVVGRGESVLLGRRDIGEHELERADNGKAAMGGFVEVLAEDMFKDGEFSDAVVFGDAGADHETTEGGGGHAATAEAGEGGEAGVVPAVHDFLLYEAHDFALRDEGVTGDEFREFVLVRERGGAGRGRRESNRRGGDAPRTPRCRWSG